MQKVATKPGRHERGTLLRGLRRDDEADDMSECVRIEPSPSPSFLFKKDKRSSGHPFSASRCG